MESCDTYLKALFVSIINSSPNYININVEIDVYRDVYRSRSAVCQNFIQQA